MTETISLQNETPKLTPEWLIGKRVIMEIGISPHGSTYSADVANINTNTVFIGVANDPRSIRRLPSIALQNGTAFGVLLDVVSQEFRDEPIFDGQIDLLYAFNVLDAIGRPLDKNDYNLFFSKIARMLKNDTSVAAIGHWYSAEFAAEIQTLPFESYGLHADVYEGDACKQALLDNGFTEHLAAQTALHDPANRFVIILKKLEKQ